MWNGPSTAPSGHPWGKARSASVRLRAACAWAVSPLPSVGLVRCRLALAKGIRSRRGRTAERCRLTALSSRPYF